MSRIAVIILLLATMQLHAQKITGKVTDALTNKPLGYATVYFNFEKSLLYTDSLGNFTLNKDSLDKKDTLYIQYLGYKKLPFAVQRLAADNIFRMVEVSQELEPVVVTNCHNFKESWINRRIGKIKDYIGPGPETRFIIIGRYAGNKKIEGYLKQLEIYAGDFNAQIHVPVRVHWYGWDTLNNMPGKELTTGNVIVYPYQQGWNSFALPANSIFLNGGSIVLGLEFIYPVEYMKLYNALPTVDEKADWLMNMKNRWSLGMQTTKEEDQSGFYQVNNYEARRYNSRGRNLYIKPAIRFTVVKCLE